MDDNTPNAATALLQRSITQTQGTIKGMEDRIACTEEEVEGYKTSLLKLRSDLQQYEAALAALPPA